MKIIEGRAQKSLVLRDMFYENSFRALLVNLTSFDLQFINMEMVGYGNKEEMREDFLRCFARNEYLDLFDTIVFYANDHKDSISWWKSFSEEIPVSCIVTIQNEEIEVPIVYDV